MALRALILNLCFSLTGRILQKFNWLFSQSSGRKVTEIFSAQGVRPAHGGTESAGKTRISEQLLGFRKAPVPDPLSEIRILAQTGETK